MKNPLFLAVVVLVVLGSFVLYTRQNPPSALDLAPSVLDVDEEDFKRLTLKKAGGDPVVAVKDLDGNWVFGEGNTIASDDTSIRLIVSSLVTLKADRIVTEGVLDWAPYALDNPDLSVAFELEEGSGELQFGKETPTGSGIFVRLKDDPRLFTVFSYNRSSFDKSLFDLRDKRLLKLDEESIREVSIKTDKHQIGFSKVENTWQISKPLKLRADKFTVRDLVRVVRTAEMTAVLEEGDRGGKYSFSKPLATVQVTDNSGSHEIVVVKDEEMFYASSSRHEGVYEVSSTVALSLEKSVEDFRSKKIFDFGYLDPVQVEVQDGERKVLLTRAAQEWLLKSDNNRKVSGELVQTLLDGLRNLTATSYPSDQASSQGQYGLKDAAIQVLVSMEDQLGTPETVYLSSLDNTQVYAARENEPSTYEIEKSAALNIRHAVEQILKDPADEEKTESTQDDTAED